MSHRGISWKGPRRLAALTLGAAVLAAPLATAGSAAADTKARWMGKGTTVEARWMGTEARWMGTEARWMGTETQARWMGVETQARWMAVDTQGD
ncbi:hypothetical protein CLV92_10941 [Kineococcus xinjiangensis]|uniref:Uncharacterized protein n=1 Tax=Kineococcus xinjiangensis TaxID=512762 RepID=A0A2S6IHV1_9ACTN|nr:hypothetical protein [Kineococcus xinjiangensis]PPK93765.1 hypothetical protein CLV92_10941 [Kineococcus xinjiangensis]